MILQEPEFDEYDLSKFRLIFYGSSPMAAEWVQRCSERFEGTELQQGYGLTETSPILTTLDPIDHRQAVRTGNTDILRAAGRPVAGVDLRIVDDAGKPVAPGDPGEVAVRGPNVTSGYLNRPEINETAFRDGWFFTGDFGRVDENGLLFLLDRKKDMVIVGGYNVYPREIDEVLYAHPAVLEAAAVGVVDDYRGEVVNAYVVIKAGTKTDSDDILTYCRKNLAKYKIPSAITLVDALPKTTVGKIDKKALRGKAKNA